MTTAIVEPPALRTDTRTIFGHPIGLAYMAFTETWERFSFFGMQTLLVLYMVNEALLPGHVEQILGFGTLRGVLEGAFGPMSPQALSSTIYGFYASFAYLLPLFGGMIADRLLGQYACVISGAILMAIGHFLMVFEASFLIALAALMLGFGLMKGNLAAQIGSLYGPTDRRRGDAFLIYYFAINTGAVMAPLVCGGLGETLGWHYGFAAAGVGMLIGLAIYISGRRHLPPDRRVVAKALKHTSLTVHDWKVIAAIGVVLFVNALYLGAGNQMGNVYLLWLRAEVDRSAFGWTIPATWFLSFTIAIAMISTPIVMGIWRWQARQGWEPNLLTKIAMGCGFTCAAFLLLAVLSATYPTGNVSWAWMVLFHAFVALAYLHVSPLVMAICSRAAPIAVATTVMGAYYLPEFLAHMFGGRLGAFYEKMSHVQFWAINAIIPALGVLIIVLLGRILRPLLLANRTDESTPIVERTSSLSL